MGNCLKISNVQDQESRLPGTLIDGQYPTGKNENMSMMPQRSEISNSGYQTFGPGSKYNPKASFDRPYSQHKQSGSVASTTTDATRHITEYLPFSRTQSKQNLSIDTNTVHEAPEGCIVVVDATLVDSLGGLQGLEMWRAESGQFGLVLAKVLEPRIGGPPSSASVGKANIDLQATAEDIFETELKMLSLVQGMRSQRGTGSYRSKSPMKGGTAGDVYRCQHDNIIGFVGYMEATVGTSSPSLERRLITEYYTDTLRDHIEHRTQFGKKEMRHFEASLYAFQLAKGLHAIHGLGVVHRDLNPENIVMGLGLLDKEYKEWLKYVSEAETKRTLETYATLAKGGNNPTPGATLRNNAAYSTRSGLNNDAQMQMQLQMQRRQTQNIHYYKFLQTQPLVAKIANFGNARQLQHHRATTKIGSMHFMAPEMIKGEEYDFACDIWSFGAILFEMISGKPPFYKKNPSYIEARVVGGRFPRSDPIGSKGFDGLQIIMRNCLKTEPNLRSTAKDLVEDLGKL